MALDLQQRQTQYGDRRDHTSHETENGRVVLQADPIKNGGLPTNHVSSFFNSARIGNPTSARCLAAARVSLVYFPCVVRAAVRSARPSSVSGRTDAQHCSLLRPKGCLRNTGRACPYGSWHRTVGRANQDQNGIFITRLKSNFCHCRNPRICVVL
jgi:hypothetical protein